MEKVKERLKMLLGEPGATKVRKAGVNADTEIKRIKKKIKQVINELVPNIRITAKASL